MIKSSRIAKWRFNFKLSEQYDVSLHLINSNSGYNSSFVNVLNYVRLKDVYISSLQLPAFFIVHMFYFNMLHRTHESINLGNLPPPLFGGVCQPLVAEMMYGIIHSLVRGGGHAIAWYWFEVVLLMCNWGSFSGLFPGICQSTLQQKCCLSVGNLKCLM